MTAVLTNPNHSAARPEAAELCLARNLTSARLALGWTQERLAVKAQVSRATIVQIEHGLGDPRLSTIGHLASSLEVSIFWLLVGLADMKAMSDLVLTLPPDPRLQRLSRGRLTEMQQWVASGMIHQRKRAAQQGAALAQAAGLVSSAVITTAIGTALYPGPGTLVGAVLGERCARHPR